MRFCFILACVTGREHLLNKFVESVKLSKYKDCDYYLYYQNVADGTPSGEFDRSIFKEIHVSNTRDGVLFPRMYWLNELEDYDFYIIVDDDMEFLGFEDYESMMDFAAAKPDCGCLCCDYKRHIRHYPTRRPAKIFKIKQMQFIEGGLVIKKNIRDLFIKSIPMEKLSYDGFCITTFINGYNNYKYFGSVSLHKCTNGVNGFVYVKRHSDQYVPFYEKYILQTHYEHNGELRLPLSEADLTDEALQMHFANEIKE